MFRGVNHCQLFEEREDYETLLTLLEKVKIDLGMELFAYCLMSNHAHLLIKESSPGVLPISMSATLEK